jgi:hypothetical protein
MISASMAEREEERQSFPSVVCFENLREWWWLYPSQEVREMVDDGG